MRKSLAAFVSVSFVAALFAACSGDDNKTDGGGDATADVVTEKKPLPETGPSDTGGQCSPSATVDTSQIKWVPPVTPNPTACSDVQAKTYFDSCFGTNGSATACNAFTTNAANATCYTCLASEAGGPETSYGVLVAYGNIYYPNTAGCIALVTGDSSSSSCGAKLQATIDCDNLACAPNCPAVTSATINEYNACTQAAESGACKTLAEADCNLADGGVDGGAAAIATCEATPTDFQATYYAYVPLFCGGYATDGGTDGGSDAASDAAVDAPDGD